MGMMDMPQSQPQAPMQGMMQPQAQAPQQQPGYNGEVLVNGEKVPVQNGVAVFNQQKYFVSADGALVLDMKLQPVGYVEQGEFHPMDEKHIGTLKQLGYL